MSKGKQVYRVVHVEHPETHESHVFGPGQKGGDRLPEWAAPLVTMDKVFEPFPGDDPDAPVNEQPVPAVDPDTQQVGIDGTQVGGTAPDDKGEKPPAKKAPAKKAATAS